METPSNVDVVEPSPFQSILNFRDVGRTINRLQDKVCVFLVQTVSPPKK